MRVVFSPEARAEFDEAMVYYEHELKGLGERLKREVREALPRMQTWPHAWPKERGEIRKYILPRFPYKLLYSAEIDHLYVLAFAHLHRKPGYWTRRQS